MSLPVPKLDDRTFQSLVDEAKARIPQYCPEWTDHNVSDPGVTLIELFAWMTEMLLYRVNQVPDKIYTKLLELIGIRLDPPRAAEAPVTFYLSAPQPIDVSVAEGTEVATVRTETSPPIVFTTESRLTVRHAIVKGVFTHGPNVSDPWVRYDVGHLEYGNHPFEVFSHEPVPGDALYLALQADHSRHVMAVRFVCDNAAGPGVNPIDPPLAWEVWQGADAGWSKCEVEYDWTRALNTSGDVILQTPHMEPGVLSDQGGYWLRCKLTESSVNQGSYYSSPLVSQLRVESRGAIVTARHAVTVTEEILGRSDGTPGQVFTLRNTPLLSRESTRDHLIVELPSGEKQKWQEVDDFADSNEDDCHYTLDSITGELALGPSLLQPTGKVYRFGVVPPKGAELRMARYQYGGGYNGNLPVGAITQLKSSIPYIARIFNWRPASGGLDPQSLEDAKLRAPHMLRSRTRAVTADDYVHIAARTPGVARAFCLAPGAQPPSPHDPPPGHVVVLLVPSVDDVTGPITPELLDLSPDLAQGVKLRLDSHRLVGTSVEVRSPHYQRVSVTATLRVAPGTERAIMDDVQVKGEEILYRYLNPYTGGPHGDGWPLGRDLNRAELLGLLQQIPEVEYADELRVSVVDGQARSAGPVTAAQHLVVPFDALVCSGGHQLRVNFARDEG
jgi:predicted phage baseplate assembly protein